MKRIVVIAVCARAASCARSADVATGLQLELVNSGWRGADAAAGRSKIVPSAAVKVSNVSGRTLPSVQVNAVFHRAGDRSEWGSAFVTASGSSGMTPGGAATVMLESQLGYTGEDPTDALLRNSQFVDATVDVFAKYGSRQWERLGAFPIERQILR